MALYQVTIAYDGSDFCGFQRQLKGRTIQEELECTLTRMGWNEESITFSGRTDAGVHAEGQVIAFNLLWSHSEQELIRALNDYLPEDIAAVDCRLVEPEFHPRYQAKLRVYRYQIYLSFFRNPLKDRYFWRVWPIPDFDLLECGALIIKGNHDFGKLINKPDGIVSSVRTIEIAEWKKMDATSFSFTISSRAFLYHMVRRIVYLLVRFGQSEFNAIELKNGLKGLSDLPAGIAPAKGLFLERVIY